MHNDNKDKHSTEKDNCILPLYMLFCLALIIIVVFKINNKKKTYLLSMYYEKGTRAVKTFSIFLSLRKVHWKQHKMKVDGKEYL
jgi:hypothetical protein